MKRHVEMILRRKVVHKIVNQSESFPADECRTRRFALNRKKSESEWIVWPSDFDEFGVMGSDLERTGFAW